MERILVVTALRLLVTGASGLVGSKVFTAARAQGVRVFGTYHEHALNHEKLLRADLASGEEIHRVVQNTAPDVIIHSAGLTDVDQCELETQRAFLVNATTTALLANECRRIGSHFVYISTDYVFDGRTGNYTESSQSNPVNAYGRSKLAGEESTLTASKTFCVARTSVVYGWGREYRANIGSWAYQELRAARPIKIVSDQYASPTLNSQLARMLLEIAQKRTPGIIHVAGETRLSRYDLVRAIASEFKLDANLIVPIKSSSASWTAKRPPDSSLSVHKVKQLLDNKPLSVLEGVKTFAKELGQTHEQGRLD